MIHSYTMYILTHTWTESRQWNENVEQKLLIRISPQTPNWLDCSRNNIQKKTYESNKRLLRYVYNNNTFRSRKKNSQTPYNIRDLSDIGSHKHQWSIFTNCYNVIINSYYTGKHKTTEPVNARYANTDSGAEHTQHVARKYNRPVLQPTL